MKTRARFRFAWLAWILVPLLVLALAAAGWAWWRIRASLPPLDGEVRVTGLGAPVKVERDALGVPTVTGASRLDVARALGFLHAQDRFFQMDLLRRSGAGELAELFGPVAVALDQSHRLHGFRRTAGTVLTGLAPERRALLEAYAAGVNAGLAALPRAPWEYAVLRVEPRAWTPEDTLLVIYAMWFDLQDASAKLEVSLQLAREVLGQTAVDFFAPRGNSWDSALDGSTFPAPELPSFRFPTPARTAFVPGPETLHPGSNSMAVAGRHAANGAALVANDMHLNLNVPHIWYRALLRWTDPAGTERRVVGVTLPGAPGVVVGSNGSIAWSFTNSYIDTLDVIRVETESTAELYYRTPQGFVAIEDRPETIRVRGADPVQYTARWTQWGPVIGGPVKGNYLALRWNAHDAAATNLEIFDLETAATVDDAVQVAHRAGMPNQNLIVADRAGSIAWTLTGKIPRRIGYDGRFPVSWGYGDRRWDGWLNPDEIPVIKNPADGLLWSANQRLVGGDAYARLGDAGYDDGPRGGQIRDDLRALVSSGKKVAPADLLGVMLDDRAVFLERWQKLLLTVLTDEVAGRRSARAEIREQVRGWEGRASPGSTAFRLVRAWRAKVSGLVLQPFFARLQYDHPQFGYGSFLVEDAVWRLVNEKPAQLLDPKYQSWDALLEAALDEVIADIEEAGLSPQRYTWGRYNTLRMRHPFSGMLPGPLAAWLDMPAQALPGAADLPRVQGPGHGASERLVVAPGREEEGLFHMPGGQSGNPASPFYRAGHEAWAEGRPTPLLPGPARHVLTLRP